MKKLSTLTMLVLALLIFNTTLAVPKLNSLPGTPAVIFLDFDGQYVNSGVWNNAMPFNCAAAALSDVQITEIFNRVAEDYRPFAVNITTDSTVFFAAPLIKRVRMIITSTSAWFPGVGGVTYIGSFTWGDDTPGFIFSDRLGPNSPKMIAECCSHESGHAVGLSHQSRYDGANCTTPVEQYNSGLGTGEASWAPIMGNSYYKNMTNWNNGPTPYGCTNLQDNLSIIATQNGFGYRADDYTAVMNGTTTIVSGSFTKQGIITTDADKDAFRFTMAQRSVYHLTANPFSVGANNTGANLDIKIQLYNGATLVRTYDPASSMSVTIDTTLNAGTYYLLIDGTGNTNIGQYGSLGSYTITGINSALPIHDINLSGNTDNDKHNLSWTVTADEPVKTVTVESSADGTNFTELVNVPLSSNAFSYNPFKNSSMYYRVKVTSVTAQTVYSNTIVLKGVTTATDNIFKVSTLVHNDITVNAAMPYQYQLMDMNGRLISKGAGAGGFNTINIGNQPGGIYIIQLLSNNKKQTERILKQ